MDPEEDFEDDNLDDMDDREECFLCGMPMEECTCDS